MNTTTKLFKGTAVEMLIATGTIIQNVLHRKDFLQTKRPDWSDILLQELANQNNILFNTYIGKTNLMQLKNQTLLILSLSKTAKIHLSEFKVQIRTSFRTKKDRQKEILTTLGFTKYFKEATQGDQESLIALLYQFKQNLTPNLKNEINTAGMSPNTMQSIIDLAQELKNANVDQESFKMLRKELTLQDLNALNDYYIKVTNISIPARVFFKGNKLAQDEFSYTYILKQQSTFRGS